MKTTEKNGEIEYFPETFIEYADVYISKLKFITCEPITSGLNNEGIFKLFKKETYNLIPFELRIGLLKFICDNTKCNLLDTYGLILYGGPTELKKENKTIQICPKEFLETFK